MKLPLFALIGSTRRVADAKRDHPVDPNKMVCAHDPDPDQVRVYGFKGSETTRCLRCDAKLRHQECKRCDRDGSHVSMLSREAFPCDACDGSGFGPWRDAI